MTPEEVDQGGLRRTYKVGYNCTTPPPKKKKKKKKISNLVATLVLSVCTMCLPLILRKWYFIWLTKPKLTTCRPEYRPIGPRQYWVNETLSLNLSTCRLIYRPTNNIGSIKLSTCRLDSEPIPAAKAVGHVCCFSTLKHQSLIFRLHADLDTSIGYVLQIC